MGPEKEALVTAGGQDWGLSEGPDPWGFVLVLWPLKGLGGEPLMTKVWVRGPGHWGLKGEATLLILSWGAWGRLSDAPNLSSMFLAWPAWLATASRWHCGLTCGLNSALWGPRAGIPCRRGWGGGQGGEAQGRRAQVQPPPSAWGAVGGERRRRGSQVNPGQPPWGDGPRHIPWKPRFCAVG